MKSIPFAAALVVAAGLFTATPAGAVVYTITYRGVVTDGFDQDLFGGLGAGINGRAFTAVYRVDTLAPGSAIGGSSVAPLFTDSYVFGLSAAVPVSARLTINDRSVDMLGANRDEEYNFGQSYEFDGSPERGLLSQIDHVVEDASRRNYFTEFGAFYEEEETRSLNSGAYSYLNDFGLDGDVHTPAASRTLIGGDIGTGGFSFIRRTTLEPQSQSPQTTIDRFAFGGLLTQSYEVALVVPEPATWSLMIAGFGAAGARLRRHRRSGTQAHRC